MPEFQTMFMQSKGQPIQWQGEALYLHDYFPTLDATKYRLTMESCRAVRRQGVILALVHKDAKGRWQPGAAKGRDGQLLINGQSIGGKTGTVIWHDTAPPTIDFEIAGGAPVICVYNVWESNSYMPGANVRPLVDSGHNGAAMMVEELPNGRRYRCNDGEPDDDFDDLIFRLERVR